MGLHHIIVKQIQSCMGAQVFHLQDCEQGHPLFTSFVGCSLKSKATVSKAECTLFQSADPLYFSVFRPRKMCLQTEFKNANLTFEI